MSNPRRRIVRPTTATTSSATRHRVDTIRQSIGQEQAALARWMNRLKRAFHAVEKQQRRIANLERRVRKLEDQ